MRLHPLRIQRTGKVPACRCSRAVHLPRSAHSLGGERQRLARSDARGDRCRASCNPRSGLISSAMIAIEEICFPMGAPPELTRAAEEITQALAASSEVCADVVAEIQRSMAQLAITWEAMGAAQELQRQELQKSVAQITQAWEGIDLTAVFTEQAKVAEQALAEQAAWIQKVKN